MVLLAVRPYEGAHFNLGRETFLIPVAWEVDGWLRVDNKDTQRVTDHSSINLLFIQINVKIEVDWMVYHSFGRRDLYGNIR